MKKNVIISIIIVFLLTSCETLIQELNRFSETTTKFIEEAGNDRNNEDNGNKIDEKVTKSTRTEIIDPEFTKYKSLNDNEQRYIEFKDSDEELFVKIKMLDYINLSREKFNVSKLELDILASRTANKTSYEAAKNNFMGHWNLNGEKPYHRYAISGGFDHVTENAAASWSTNSFINNSTTALNFMKEAHNSFMAEKAPNDGHKKNVITKEHNYVGIGYKIIGNQFRYYEEYIDRYLDISTGGTSLTTGMDASFSFKTLSEKLYPYSVIVYYEASLKKMTSKEINNMGSYSDFSNNTVFSVWPWELPEKNKNGYITISFPVQKKGSYYVNIYLSDKPNTDTRSANTVGKIQASGIVFFVE